MRPAREWRSPLRPSTINSQLSTAADLRQCPGCQYPLTPDLLQKDEPAPCVRCGILQMVRAFPLFIHGPKPGTAGELLADPSLAACFFHPTRQAALPCEACGRFLCSLCDCELDGRHLCPACLSEGKKKGRLDALRIRHTRFDNIALLLAVAPPFTLVGAYFTAFTAATALWLVIAKWRTPRQALLPYNRWRFVVAGLVALAQLALWSMVIYFLFFVRFRR